MHERRQLEAEVLRDVREDVDAGDVHRPERRALRPAERRPGDRVDLLDRVAAALERLQRQHHAVEPEVVGDEVRRVLRDDDALAEAVIGELRHALDDRRIGVGGRDDLDAGAGSAAG